MGKKWVYVLKNTNNEYNYIYVGETLRLFRRFNEHLEGYGSKNTSEFQNVELIGIYDVIQNNIFIEYHSWNNLDQKLSEILKVLG